MSSKITFRTQPDNDKATRIGTKIVELLGDSSLVLAVKGTTINIEKPGQLGVAVTTVYSMPLKEESKISIPLFGMERTETPYYYEMPNNLMEALRSKVRNNENGMQLFGKYIVDEGAVIYPSSGGGRRKSKTAKKSKSKSKSRKASKKSKKSAKKSKKSSKKSKSSKKH
jgi:hypothetical protein